MWAVGETCLYSKSQGVDYTFACIKDVDDIQKRLLVGSFAEDDRPEWVPMSCVLSIDNETQLLSAITAPNANAACEELDKLFYTSKVNKALSLEDNPESLSRYSIPEHSVQQNRGHGSAWRVGDICICQWSEDKNYYYAEIREIYTETQTCNVSFLFYENEEVVSLTDLYSHKAPEARLVTDESNIRTAAERLISNLCDKMEGVSTKSAPVTVNKQAGDKSRSLKNPPTTKVLPTENAQRKEVKPEPPVVSSATATGSLAPPPFPVPFSLPPNWTDLIVADQAPLQALLTSWFMCGYHTGYYEGLKARESRGSRTPKRTNSSAPT
ncbi:hypothetical protein AAHC03_05518 [Spirometra sp. Aus1]